MKRGFPVGIFEMMLLLKW